MNGNNDPSYEEAAIELKHRATMLKNARIELAHIKQLEANALRDFMTANEAFSKAVNKLAGMI